MEEVRLTDEQRKFAEEQHYVLLDFLEKRRLAMDEYYDIVVFPFLEAVCRFDMCKDFIDETFEVFARRNMNKAISRHFKEEKRKKKYITFLSLDYPVSYSESISFGDTITDDRTDPFDRIERKLSRPAYGYRLLDRYSGGRAIRQICMKEVC